jgi:ATP-dependent helicase/nuclease subunit B
MPLPDAIVAALDAGHTLVTPSPQRAVAVREAWARRQVAAGRRVWSTPDVLHFDAWVERGLARGQEPADGLRRLLSPVEQQLAWRSAARAVMAAEDTELLGASRLADSLRRADALVRSHEIPGHRLTDDGSPEARWLGHARATLQRCLDQHEARLGWQSERPAWANCVAVDRPARLIGFDTLLPAQRALVAATLEQGGHPAQLPVAGDTLVTPRVVGATDSVEELQRIAVWCREHLQRKPAAQLLVVLPDLDSRRTLLERALLDELDPGALAVAEANTDLLAIEGGQALAALPRVARDLETLTRLIEPLEREDWLRWLRGPLALEVADSSHATLESALLAWQGEALTLAGLLHLARLDDASAATQPAWLARTQRALQRLSSRSDTSAGWARQFDQALRLMAPAQGNLDSAAWQTHARWQQLLEDFAAAQAIAGALGARDALRQLRSLALRTRFAPAAPAAAVLMTAATADPIVQYDGIWVGGLHEAAFPRGARSEAFLPWGLQREYGVADCDPDALLARARHELQAWRRCTPDLWLSYAREDNGAEQAPSPLLRPWLPPGASVAPVPVPARRGAAHYQRTARGSAASLESQIDHFGSPLPPGVPLAGGTAVLASSNQCAFRGYAQLRLSAHAADEPHAGIDARARGLLYHRALQQLWQQWQTPQALRHLTDAQRRMAIENALETAAGRGAARAVGTVAERAVARETRRALELIDELLRLEAQRPDFLVEMLERQLPLRIGPILLELRIDRVDRLAEGSLVVIDYKTGRGVPSDWNSARPDTVQMLAYHAALRQYLAEQFAAGAQAEIVGLCYAQLSESQVRYRGVVRQAAPLSPALPTPRTSRSAVPWADRSAAWDLHLAWLGDRIAAGDATVEPAPAVCRSCDLTLLCRRAEQVVAVDDEDAGGDDGDDPSEDAE